MFKIRYINNPNLLESKLKVLHKINVIDKNLHDIKQEILVAYGGEFEKNGKSSIGDQIKRTHIRFRNITEYEHYINAVDEGYDAEDAIFNVFLYKINTLQFNLVIRSQ